METPRPRGATENRIFKRVPHDLSKLTSAVKNGGRGGSVGGDRGTAVPRAVTHLTRKFAASERGDHLQLRIFIKVAHQLLRFTTVDENGLSTPARSIENSPALQRWVGVSSELTPGGTTEPLKFPVQSSLQDSKPYKLLIPALKRWANFECSYGARLHRSAP